MVDRGFYFEYAYFSYTSDKAYNSREIFNFLDNMELAPYIPFKKNCIGRAEGSHIWREMYCHFRNSPDIYNEHHHARSNVETCFHMLKQRFGSQLMTKNFVANQNEILVRMLCHNFCVLIQEAYEHGVKIDFDACLKMGASVQK